MNMEQESANYLEVSTSIFLCQKWKTTFVQSSWPIYFSCKLTYK